MAPIHGYPRLAHLMGRQEGLAIFRRFATLNAKNLLYLQAELLKLEEDLATLEEMDSSAEDEKSRTFATNVSQLMEAEEGGLPAQQWEKVLEIRAKLKDYNELLLTHAALYKLPKPNPHDFNVLCDWLEDKKYGRGFLGLFERHTWVKPLTDDSDLVALSVRPGSSDKFTRWFTDSCVPFLHRKLILPFKKPISHDTGSVVDAYEYVYEDKKLDRVTAVIAVVLASTLPSVSIFALYYISRPVIRLAFILIFSAVFSTALAVFTGARRVDIFLGTVALASVQVVFIGTNGQPGSLSNGQ